MIEDIPAIAEIVHRKGALLIVSIAEAISLGVVRPPVEADIVSLEAQSFGVALSFGGPYCGVIAAKEKVSAANAGPPGGRNRGYGRPARFRPHPFHPRTTHPPGKGDVQHLHQPGAGSLSWQPSSTTVYGKQGMRELATHNLAKANYAARQFSSIAEARACSSPALRVLTNSCSRPQNLRINLTPNCSSRK